MPPRNGWSADQVKLMEWLCLPGDDLLGKGKGLRHPATITGLARELGYSRETIYEWQTEPGWEEALAIVAEKTTYSLKPEFYRVLNAALMQPGRTGYDRIFTAYQRYLAPMLEDKKFNGDWERNLPALAGKTDNGQLNYAEGVRLIRDLPTEHRETFLNILENLFNQSSKPEIVGRYLNVRKIYEGEEEEPEQLPALPAPTPSDDTTPIQPDTTPRYDPGRGMRKPIRKPRDTKR
jgi:hypothetical protein